MAAAALAAATRDDAGRTGAFGDASQRIWPIECLLEAVVAPVATQAAPSGVLFVLLDGMSAASVTSIAEDAVGRLRFLVSLSHHLGAHCRLPLDCRIGGRDARTHATGVGERPGGAERNDAR